MRTIKNIIIAVLVVALAVSVAFQLRPQPKAAKTMPLSSIETVGYQKSPNHFSSVGPIGFTQHHVEEQQPFTELEKAELKKAIHDSTKTKAADQNEAGDW